VIEIYQQINADYWDWLDITAVTAVIFAYLLTKNSVSSRVRWNYL